MARGRLRLLAIEAPEGSITGGRQKHR